MKGKENINYVALTTELFILAQLLAGCADPFAYPQEYKDAESTAAAQQAQNARAIQKATEMAKPAPTRAATATPEALSTNWYTCAELDTDKGDIGILDPLQRQNGGLPSPTLNGIEAKVRIYDPKNRAAIVYLWSTLIAMENQPMVQDGQQICAYYVAPPPVPTPISFLNNGKQARLDRMNNGFRG